VLQDDPETREFPGMKVLMVSQYADPNLVGGNNNIYRQARALKHALGVNVEILTWPEGDLWAGPLPAAGKTARFSHMEWSYEGLTYHVVKLPKKLLERVVTESDWREAVETGCELLKKIDPAIVHLQHWRGLWWILESSGRLSIPAVYSSHDWGLGCLRTILVKGEGGLCDGVIGVDKCVECIWNGRTPRGKVNELLVSTAMGERLMKMLGRSSFEPWLSRHGAVGQGLRKRVALNHDRARAVLSGVSALVVPSRFAKDFFVRLGVAADRIHVEPWYYDLTVPADSVRADREKVVLGYIGRISPEKGLERIFKALSNASLPNPVHLVVAGAIKGEYAERLHSEFRRNVGKHSVEWMGWLPHDEIHKFYEKTDVVIISSEWMDNTPLTLVESFAFKRPVIIPDIPTIRDLVQEGRTGFLTAFASTESLEQAIGRVSLRPHDMLEMRKNIPDIKTSADYARVIKDIYDSVVRESIAG
jgi:glycosyltransferase involved in cell wall biosynthesis